MQNLWLSIRKAVKLAISATPKNAIRKSCITRLTRPWTDVHVTGARERVCDVVHTLAQHRHVARYTMTQQPADDVFSLIKGAERVRRLRRNDFIVVRAVDLRGVGISTIFCIHIEDVQVDVVCGKPPVGVLGKTISVIVPRCQQCIARIACSCTPP